MPDLYRTSNAVRSQLMTLQSVATQAVTHIGGVGHIEPSFSQAVQNLRLNHGQPPVAGTVHLSRGADQSTNAGVELCVTPDRTAYDTAQDVRATLVKLLVDHGHVPGHISVTVLHLHDAPPAV